MRARKSKVQTRTCGLLYAAFILTTLGCAGYQIGSPTLYRSDVRTVSVPVFQSDSFRQFLGERLTEAVIKEIESETPYKVVGGDRADSILAGKIISDSKRLLSETQTDEARNLETELLFEMSWTNRFGQPLMTRPILRINSNANFIPEAGQSLTTAQQEAIDRLAREIVAQMQVPW